MHSTLIDKAIGIFDPQAELKRVKARASISIVNSGYSHHGASKTKKSLAGWFSKGRSPKEDIDKNLKDLRERSRDLYMGVPIATAALKNMQRNIVGSGLKPNAQIDHAYLGMSEDEAAVWEDHVEREFNLWAESVHCDMQRRHNFYRIQAMVLLFKIMSGETFVTLPIKKRPQIPYDLRLMIIEADRICTPDNMKFNNRIINGVEESEDGEVIAYYVCNVHPGSVGTGVKKWTRVPVYGGKSFRPNILHPMVEPERPGQRRGVPILAPVIESLKQIGRYTEAELMAAVISGMFTVFIEQSEDDAGDPLLGSAMGDEDDDEDDDGDDPSYGLGNGAVVGLGPGEKATIANPGRPNTAFDPFVVAIIKQIGAALGMPYEQLVLHFTSSYSASRASLLEAWKMYKTQRAWLVDEFCQPVYETWLSEAIAKGRVHAPGFFSDPMIRKAYCGVEWNGPTAGQVDPIKEVKAASMRVQEGFSTRQRETQELTGGDFYKNHRKRVREETLRKEGGLIPNE